MADYNYSCEPPSSHKEPVIRIETVINAPSSLSSKFDTKTTTVTSMGATKDFEGAAVRYIDVRGSRKGVDELIALLDDNHRSAIINVYEK